MLFRRGNLFNYITKIIQIASAKMSLAKTLNLLLHLSLYFILNLELELY